MRIFHSWTREDLAEAMRVSVRTVFRWERDGVDPATLQLDPGAKSGPEWRRNLLMWLLDRLEAPGVSDTRKKQGESA
jgi:transcriptional regulator with XRE-family HTH domain